MADTDADHTDADHPGDPLSQPLSTLRRRSWLGSLAEFSIARPKAVLVVAAFFALFSLSLVATRLELKTSNLDLIDASLPAVERFRQVASELGTPNVLCLVLESEDPQALGDAVDLLAARLRALEGVRGVIDRSPVAPEIAAVTGVDPHLISDDGELAVLFVQPADPESRADLLLPFIHGVRRILDEARLETRGVAAGLTGMPAYAIEDREIIERDITRLSAIGGVLVALLTIAAFGSWRRPAAAVIALLWAVVIDLGVASIFPGHLTLLSAFFASILLGLGIDFAIHILDRSHEKQALGEALRTALPQAISELQAALLTGGITTAGVFFAMQASGFQGFAELGLIAGIGVLLCLLAMVTVLPAMLSLRAEAPSGPEKSRPQRLTLRRRSPLVRRLVATLLGVGVLSSVAIPAPEFDSDYLNLQPRDSEAVRLERELVARSDFSPLFAVFMADSREHLADLRWLLADDETVGSTRSLKDFEIGGVPLAISDDLRASLETASGRLAIYAFPAGDVWRPEQSAAFLAQMRAIDPDVTGMPFLGELMIARSKRALKITSMLGALILLFVVTISLRRPTAVLLAILPAFATFVTMHAIMRLTGLAYNPLDIMALPVVLGIAVDDGIHIVHRFIAENGHIGRTLAGSGRSVLLTSLTTLGAFGCLALTDHRGLASFALVLCLGVACALVLSLWLLPELLVACERRVLPIKAPDGR